MNSETDTDSLGRVYLQPIAAPSILGLYAFAGATFIVAAEMAAWYGDSKTALYLFPFAAVFGGVAQFAAGMWSYKARDGLATAMHGMWGSFWVAYGILHAMFATGVLTEPSGAFPALGYWFFALAAITMMGTLAAMAENLALTLVLGTLTLGSACAGIAEITGSSGWTVFAGWVFIVSALLAWYTASALMLEGVGKAFLPIGKTSRAKQAPKVDIGSGEPGVKHGQ
ncbi:MAG: GPR1/FUN34/YaaH family transporter [Pseudomonadota bacterium]|nr:GPR1/FUN34/YaaH family transporter [Pseudomonadota bacterium]